VNIPLHPGQDVYYENLVLKLAKIWSCHKEVVTSEGVVSSESGNTANVGHFAYLRVTGDGKKYKYTDQQREIFQEEQGGELAVESQRRQALDDTGQARNSTYVRENYDPQKPPLEVYYSSLD
jgi:hypothetical protein